MIAGCRFPKLLLYSKIIGEIPAAFQQTGEWALMNKHILLVDDDDLLRRSLSFSLEQAGYRVSALGNAEDALALARRDLPDLVLLDIGLPGMDGLDALRLFRDQMHVPVIFLTARRRELDEVLGLELGADDYITKPFQKDVLLAHIRAVLRRPEHMAVPSERELKTLTVGDLVVDAAAHTVTLGGRMVDLSPREFDLLHALALEAGRVVPMDALLARVWGEEYVGEPQVVYVHVRWLRDKLEEDPRNPRRIVTVRGVGYKLEPQTV
jgi:DNA-binding response OmpR family regulator